VSEEIDLEAGEAIGGFWRFRRRATHAVAPGSPCANCGTLLMGPWCHQCGQVAEDFHRSIWKLIGEAFEGVFHFDSRVWVTLPDLLSHPARLTLAYLDGHRAPQVPPFRLFLVVLLAVFLAGSLGRGHMFKAGAVAISTDAHGRVIATKTRPLDQLSPAERASIKSEIAKSPMMSVGGGWLSARMARVLDDPRRFWMVLETWAERFAFLALPMAVLLISLAFVFQRRFYVFDHTIFSLHSLSAVGLLVTGYEIAGALIGPGASLILWAAPVHLFVHMRGVYRTSVVGTLARMAFVFAGSLVIGFVIFSGLVLVGLSGMEA
jgi:hypothetical protein